MSQALSSNPTVGGVHQPAFTFSGYVVELWNAQGQLVPGGCNMCTPATDLTVPGPNTPLTQSWLSANAGKLVTVPATSGQGKWRVIARRVTYYHPTGPFGLPTGPTQPGVLTLGPDLGRLDHAVRWLPTGAPLTGRAGPQARRTGSARGRAARARAGAAVCRRAGRAGPRAGARRCGGRRHPARVAPTRPPPPRAAPARPIGLPRLRAAPA